MGDCLTDDEQTVLETRLPDAVVKLLLNPNNNTKASGVQSRNKGGTYAVYENARRDRM